MKNQLTCLLIFLLIGAGCQKEPIDQIIDECVGATFYYLDNQSSRALSIRFAGPHLNSQIDSATVVNPKQRVLIGQDAAFGASPHPADTFSSITLLSSVVNGKKTIVYTQAPVQTTLWTKQKRNPADPDFGCQEVYYSWTITDDLLK
ncbi:hypothetical protein [Arsenicibacter rosenii]|uniref:Uncharacterized protein n=1 Tax=Arsenicibacter rosenii TaxID=1750698 RepID=A0A1S2VFB2_9BACT|nr:hypothetical protein [Arsenicibacter rosenii]OIN57399.1 hypothetical protein BLX24_19385 [Arsenicibacter rosenii]